MNHSPAPRQPSHADVIAAVVGLFDNVRPLAQGGQGAVYRATPHGSAEEVALKIYFGDQLDERTAREIAALKRLKGETIVRLHADGAIDIGGNSYNYIATTFIEGDVLSSVLTQRQLSFTEIAAIGRDVALAIDELWANDRIVHRDVKPSNVMLRADGRAVLIDLGVARHLNLSPLTTAGKTWGTEGYMAPEHARGNPLSCKADVFALGVLLQESLLQHHPTAHRQALLMNGGLKTSALRPDTPAELARIIDLMLDRSPGVRPSPRRVADALQAFIEATS
ncbi:MAG TPA: serine/threonine-protein kinase [Thermoanaerobaculia bacterium]|nr:serine/threonine-protein kinase [Thermoanaerobaculia bacterium]